MKKRLKKFCLFTALWLFFVVSLPCYMAYGEIAEGPLLFNTMGGEEESFITAMTTHQNSLYVYWVSRTQPGGIYRYQAENKQLDLVIPWEELSIDSPTYSGKVPFIDTLLSSGEGLFALDRMGRKVYQIDDQGEEMTFTQVVTIDLSPLPSPEEVGLWYIESAITPKHLILWIEAIEEISFPGGQYLFDLTTGQGKEVVMKENLTQVIPYQGDEVILVTENNENSWFVEGELQGKNNSELFIYDVVKEEVVREIVIPDPSMYVYQVAYNREKDSLLLYSKGALYTMTLEGEIKKQAVILGEPRWVAQASHNTLLYGFASGGGATYTTQGVSVLLPDENPLQGKPHVIATGIDIFLPGELIDKVRLALPQITLEERSDYYDGSRQLLTAMISKDTQLDLLIFDTQFNSFYTLAEKGFFQPLNQGEVFPLWYNHLHEAIQQAITFNGEVYAAPYRAEVLFPLGIRKDLFEEMSLPVPESFFELMDLVENWNENMEEYQNRGNALPIPISPDKGWLYNWTIELYLKHLQHLGEEIAFDTPLFNKMMERVINLPIENLLNATLGEEGYLIEPWYYYAIEKEMEMGKEDHSLKPMVLAINSGEEKIKGEIKVEGMALYQGSQHLEEGKLVLNTMMEHFTQEEEITLFKTASTSMMKPYYQEELAEHTQVLKDIEKALEEEEEKKGELEEIKAQAERNLEEFLLRGEYLLSPQEIENYQEYLREALPFYYREFLDNDGYFNLVEGLITGTYSLQQWIQKADTIVEVMRLEE